MTTVKTDKNKLLKTSEKLKQTYGYSEYKFETTIRFFVKNSPNVFFCFCSCCFFLFCGMIFESKLR